MEFGTLTLLVGWGLTAGGWIVSGVQANRREERKEKRAEVDACCKLAADLLEKARKYYSKPGNDPAQASEAAEIAFGVRRLIKRMERLERQEPRFKLSGVTVEILERFTGDEFQSVSRAAISANDPRMVGLEEVVNWAIDTLEQGHAESFKTLRQRWVEWRTAQRSWSRSLAPSLFSIADLRRERKSVNSESDKPLGG